MLKATKVRLYPTPDQCQSLAFQFGAMRWAYNFALNWRQAAWSESSERISKRMLLDRLLDLNVAADTQWLKAADSQALQQSVIHLDAAFRWFFRRQGGYPRFKSKRGKQALSYPRRVKVVDGTALYLPKVGTVRAVLHRALVGKIKTVTVTGTPTGKYDASIRCDDRQVPPEPVRVITGDKITVMELGLSHLAVVSTGEKQRTPRFVKRASENLRRKQKSLSRKKNGAANRTKARVLVAKAHEKTANTRNDFQHQLSRRLIDESQAIGVETLRVKNLLKNRKLAKYIADVSWGELVRKLVCKAAWAGKHLVKIDPWYASSKTCSCCGSKIESSPLSVRQWICSTCGTEHDRDLNAAPNIRQQGILKLKSAGLCVSACGGWHKTSILPSVA
ncbi:MAG: RNA-guided endonuclease TnpB family protein [Aestuariivita sp.]|nr:RNA-guided endonuclease TnpB family protein [Aestuariivita sp.]MCY4345297.1 RNA-guided endonuclease TnpB family protein [Aestuariivita sp.]